MTSLVTPRFARLASLAALLAATSAVPAAAGVKRVWAVNDSEKIARDNLSSPLAAKNSAWDGRRVNLFGARNEVLAVQVIVEADARGIAALSLRLPELRLRGARGVRLQPDVSRIAYAPPAADPTDWVGRPIQLFALRDMRIPGPSTASWIYKAGTPSAPRGTGWQPVQIVPENARRGRGGFPLTVPPSSNQALWIEIYTGRDRAAGTYEGTIEVTADGRTLRIPVALELFDFALPDENSLNAMVYFERDQPARYMGRRFDEEFHRFAHRNRIELVHAYDEAGVREALPRFTGAAFTAANRYEGPGERVGNRLAPATFYGPGKEFDDRASAWARSDTWITFLEKAVPGAITFVYLPDEPGPAQYSRIRALAENLHANPGPGRRLRTFATKEFVPELDGVVDIWCAPPQHYDIARARAERAKGRDYWTYNGSRPHLGIFTIDAPAADARSVAWAAFKESISTFFYWHGVHWFHNSQKQGNRQQNTWADPITFDNRGQPGREGGAFAYGDGVLIYPGLEVLHPEEDRAIAGPISTVQLANYRRGLQDHLYLTLARKAGLDSLVDEALRAIVPRVFSESTEAVGWSEAGNDYEAMRLRLGLAIAGARREAKCPLQPGRGESTATR